MKRFLSIALAAMMLFSIFTAFGANGVSAITEISNASPCIKAEVGKIVELSGYSLVFDGGGAAVKNLTWKDESGNIITSITPDKKGVTPITAEADGKTKTVYVVAKEADEEEYVLFEVDFSKYTDISQLKEEGFVTNKQDGFYKFQDGALVMGDKNDDYTRLILPQWLGDFGDYSISTEAKMNSVLNLSRWFGIVFRIQNENNSYYPYYHICTREKTTISNGVEFAERTKDNQWNVAQKTAGSVASLTEGYNTFNVQVIGKDVQYNINNKEEIFVTEAIIGIHTPVYRKGMIGITMNNGTLSLKNIKVTVQDSAPVRASKTLVLFNNKHEDNNLRNAIANVQAINGDDVIAEINGTKNVGVAYVEASKISDYAEFLKTCKKKGVIPTINFTSMDQAEALMEAVASTSVRDINAVSDNGEILKFIRGKNVLIRNGLIVDLNTASLSSDEANVIREAVRSAPATFCIIKSENATKQAVSELQELAVAVWVQVDSAPNTDEYAIEAMKAVTSGANGIISADANLLTDVINANLAENAMTRTPIMIGHRGNPSQAPENSLSGFITAFENGADIFEVDVEITSDGEIIIMHDNTLNRTTNYTGTKKVNQMTLAEVKEYYLLGTDGKVTDEKVPTLREVLEEFKDKDCRIFVEFKGSNAKNVPATAEIIKEYGMEDRVDVISFSGSFLTQTQQNLNGMSTGFLSSYQLTCPTYPDAVEVIMRALSDSQKYNSTINTGSSVFTVHFEQAATDRGITVWPWTYTAGSNNAPFLSGCDGLTTDDVQWAKDMCKYIQSDVYEVSLNAGGTAGVNISSVTYGDAVNNISAENLTVSIVTGKDCISVENGVVKGVNAGTATVVYGYSAKTTDGSEYVLYTQPITINVTSDGSGNGGLNPWAVVGIIVGAIAIIAAVAVIAINSKKKIKD